MKTGEEALQRLSSESVDIALLDIQLPGTVNGIEVLRHIKEMHEHIVAVMVTAANSAARAVEAMKLGAFDYITKPFEPEEILITCQKALEHRALRKEVTCLRAQTAPVQLSHIVGSAPAMQRIYELIEKIKDTDVNVLISGETGTGKELVARALHDNGLRKGKPFVALNCGSMPETLVESELFGYERGAFTGADRKKIGKFELADQGTIFLDEISDLRLDLQTKLLRVLQERNFERLGGLRSIAVNVRVIAATNADLKKLVDRKTFREDLYYRLHVVPIHLPALHDRREDIPLLAEHFLRVFNKKFHKSIETITREAMNHMVCYRWPGNVRELENMMERLVVLVDKPYIDAADLPFDIFMNNSCLDASAGGAHPALKEARDRFERAYIVAALERASWNQTAAAKSLGIHRNTLLMKMEQLRIGRTNPESSTSVSV